MTFCHDRSLGERPHFTTEGVRVDGPKERQPGEYPEWFLKYVEWAQQTKHGILILQLTEAYFKLRAQLSVVKLIPTFPNCAYGLFGYVWFASLCKVPLLRSKPCRWEFGYVRQPELIYVFVYGKDGPQIVSWTDLMKDVELCNYAFGSKEGLATDLTELANNMGKDDQVTVMQTINQVQAAAELVEAQERQSWCELPLREVAYALAKSNVGNPNLEAKSAVKLIVADQSATKLINAYFETGQAARAKDLGQDLLHRQQQRLGPDHPEVAATLNNLAVAHGALGDHQTKKELLERVLKIEEEHFGPDHPDVAVTLNNLGEAHGALGDHHTKKDSLERALKIKEEHFGTDHPEVAKTLNNLANAHGALQDHRTEKDFLERALKIEELGPDHPEVAAILNNLANAHGNLGDHHAKKDLLERALKIREQHFGPDHPEVALTLNNLANAHGNLGDHHAKKDLLERALTIKEEHFGTDHPQVAITLNNLGNAYGPLGDHHAKKDLLERALRILSGHFGPDHPHVAIVQQNLDAVSSHLGNLNVS